MQFWPTTTFPDRRKLIFTTFFPTLACRHRTYITVCIYIRTNCEGFGPLHKVLRAMQCDCAMIAENWNRVRDCAITRYRGKPESCTIYRVFGISRDPPIYGTHTCGIVCGLHERPRLTPSRKKTGLSAPRSEHSSFFKGRPGQADSSGTTRAQCMRVCQRGLRAGARLALCGWELSGRVSAGGKKYVSLYEDEPLRRLLVTSLLESETF